MKTVIWPETLFRAFDRRLRAQPAISSIQHLTPTSAGNPSAEICFSHGWTPMSTDFLTRTIPAIFRPLFSGDTRVFIPGRNLQPPTKIGAVKVNNWKALCGKFYQIHDADSVGLLELFMQNQPANNSLPRWMAGSISSAGCREAKTLQAGSSAPTIRHDPHN